MSRAKFHLSLIIATTILLIAALAAVNRSTSVGAASSSKSTTAKNPVVQNAIERVEEGEQVFRFDTFGDQAFWGDTLKLHNAIEGSALGGVGPGVSPKTALAVGLKVDLDALPKSLINQIQSGAG
jgi:hypothetical protein